MIAAEYKNNEIVNFLLKYQPDTENINNNSVTHDKKKINIKKLIDISLKVCNFELLEELILEYHIPIKGMIFRIIKTESSDFLEKAIKSNLFDINEKNQIGI